MPSLFYLIILSKSLGDVHLVDVNIKSEMI